MVLMYYMGRLTREGRRIFYISWTEVQRIQILSLSLSHFSFSRRAWTRESESYRRSTLITKFRWCYTLEGYCFLSPLERTQKIMVQSHSASINKPKGRHFICVQVMEAIYGSTKLGPTST